MKKILAGLFVFGFLFAGVHQVQASVLSDALLQIQNLKKEIAQLKSKLGATALEPCVVSSFDINPKTISLGNSATVTWATNGCRYVSISGLGDVELSGSRTIDPTETTSYQLVSTDYSGSGKGSAPIYVTVNPAVNLDTTPTISVISPNSSGLSFEVGQNIEIKWSSKNIPSYETLEVFVADLSGYGSIIRTPNTGSYTYSLANFNPSSNYRAYVRRISGTPASGLSASTFTIKTATPVIDSNIEVTYPSSGLSFEVGQNMQIKWNSTNIPSSEMLEVFIGDLAANDSPKLVANTGSYTYSLANFNPSSTYRAYVRRQASMSPASGSSSVFTIKSATLAPTPGNWSAWSDSSSCVAASATSTYGYKTQTRTCTNPAPTNGGTCSGVSTQTVYCTVTPTPSITILSPNKGASYTTGQQITVKWNSVGIPTTENVSIELFATSEKHLFLTFSTPNDGVETFTLNSNIESGPYELVVTRISLGEGVSAPGHIIYINSATPAKTCDATLSARPTTTITLGESTTLSWGSNGCSSLFISGVGTVGISGTQVVTPKTTTDYELIAMKSSTDFIKKTIKVTVNPVGTPSITVTSPKGGETYKIGDKITIKWETKNIPLGVKNIYIDMPFFYISPNGAISENGGICSWSSKGDTMNDGIETVTFTEDCIKHDNGIKSILPTSARIEVMYMDSLNQNIWTRAYSNYFTITSNLPQGCDATLSASSTTITLGETTTLSWGSNGCSAVYISNVGTASNLGISGKKVVTPKMTTDYVLTAMASSTDFIKKTVRVTVNPANNSLAALSSPSVYSKTSNSAVLSANLLSLGNPAITVRGVCVREKSIGYQGELSITSSGNCSWSTEPLKTGTYTATIKDLKANTTYLYNAFASVHTGNTDATSKDINVAYSSSSEFTTLPVSSNETSSIKIISPNGEESYKIGDKVTVQWTSSNIIGNIAEINLIPNDMKLGYGLTFDKDIPNTGLYTMDLSENNLNSKEYSLGKNFKVNIVAGKSLLNNIIEDSSDRLFTINPASGLCPTNVPTATCPAFQTEAIKDAQGCIVAFVCKDITKSADIPEGDGCLPGYKYSTTIAGYLCSNSNNLKSATMFTQNNNIANNPTLGTRTLKQGVIGEDVKSLQMYLGIGADGVFGRGTAKAVREWQAANGLNPDGYFGKASYRKMNGEE